jgi:hypothetical protein
MNLLRATPKTQCNCPGECRFFLFEYYHALSYKHTLPFSIPRSLHFLVEVESKQCWLLPNQPEYPPVEISPFALHLLEY